MPGLWQLKRAALLEQRLQYLLVRGEVVDAGPLAAGQAMPRQVAGNDRVVLIQRPIDDMAVQTHVVIEAMQHHQGRHGCCRYPDLPDQLETRGLEAPQPALRLYLARRQIEPVVALIGLGLRRQWLTRNQRREAGA
ncbi:hypothetical protein D3C80_1676350 [compost metagenome]